MTDTRLAPVLVHVIHVINVHDLLYMLPDYLVVGPGSAPGVMVLGMDGTHL